MTTTTSAITTSIQHNCIARIDVESFADARCSELAAACDNNVKNGAEWEFWGADDDGDEWRVHAVRPTRED
jgi:hypothetical protein